MTLKTPLEPCFDFEQQTLNIRSDMFCSAPVRYIAMYNYKPQKADELELHKGDYYTVVEKCQDGWYKGQCLKSGIAGVFPGNYVNLCR